MEINRQSTRWWFALREPNFVIIAAAAWLALLAGMRPLALPDEGRYTDIARWMSESRDWIIPRINGLPFLHKPPLYFWLEALATSAFGLSPFVARLTSLTSAVSICCCVLWIVRRTQGNDAARWSVTALALNPLFFGGAQFANLDMLVAALITATIVLGVAALTIPSARCLWWGAYVAAAFGVLAKGLIGVVIPGLVLVAWAAACRRPSWIAKAISPVGLLLFAVIVLPWFLAAEHKYPGFLWYFIGYHHFERFLETGFNNRQGIWFYPVVLAVGMLPWTVAPLLNWRSALAAPVTRQSLHFLAGIWCAVVLVFFSIPPSKLVGYIFPLLPAFAILVGPWFAGYRYRRITAVIGGVLCICATSVAIYAKSTGPVGIAQTFKTRIASGDNVVFLGKYFFDAAIVLDRKQPILLEGDWSKRADQLPDSIRRQFTEGREFDPSLGYVLINHDALNRLIAQPPTTWVFAVESVWLADPELKDLNRVASEGRFVLLMSRGTE